MNLRGHDNFERVTAAARQSHANSRSAAGIGDREIALARLYCHAFRGHVIGAFHATRIALDAVPPAPAAETWRQVTCHGLHSLANQSLDPVPHDFRAVVSTFHRYLATIDQVLESLRIERDTSRDDRIAQIRDQFQHSMETIAASPGILPTRDNEVPEQASLVVPNLGITIVPLVYGDHHCWNLAYLSGQALDVPRHLHQEGAEIHLGYGPLRGSTVLADSRADLTEGYAMPIPAGTAHGYVNESGHDHFLPFLFGSTRLGGWGISLDVLPQPVDMPRLPSVPPAALPGLVLLDREIARSATLSTNDHRVLIPPFITARPESGALVLSIARATPTGFTYPPGPFRIVAIAQGHGRIRIGEVESPVTAHDHVGVPAGMNAVLRQEGDEPLVALDGILLTSP